MSLVSVLTLGLLGKSKTDRAAEAAPPATSREKSANSSKGNAQARRRSPAKRPGTQVAAPARKQTRVMEPSSSELAEIKAFEGNILTSPSGVAPISPEHMKFAALLDFPRGSVLIVSRSHASSHEISTVRSLLRRKGIVWRREYLVGLDVIREAYERVGHGEVAVGTTQGPAVAMEKAFIDLISDAAKAKASDIHVFVGQHEAEIRFRVDNLLTVDRQMTAIEASELCQAAFAMASDSDTTYRPNEIQGARITEVKLRSLNFKGDVQALRLQFDPLHGGGRYMVVRLLYAQRVGSTDDIDTLGYTKSQIDQIKRMRRRPVGVNVICGPTGSGKSTTLQRGLTALMREKKGLATLTIEDPPEYIIEGAAQIPVTNAQSAEDRAEKFRAAIAGALRSDPNIIMIGEIRDAPSAKLAFEAAMTGHAVWTTLHANDAISIIDRLRDQSVEMFKLSDPTLMSGLIGQRLIRRTVADKTVSFEEAVSMELLDPELFEKLRRLCGEKVSGIRFAAARESAEDYDDHFAGRTVVAEVIVPDYDFLELMRQDKKADAIKYWQSELEGLKMVEHGLLRVMRGEADPREIEDNIGFISEIPDERGKWIRERMDRL